MPAINPETIPSVPIVATLGIELLHTPPGSVSDKVVVAPTQRLSTPVMGTVAEDLTEKISAYKAINSTSFIGQV